jgi:hypothetical protein
MKKPEDENLALLSLEQSIHSPAEYNKISLQRLERIPDWKFNTRPLQFIWLCSNLNSAEFSMYSLRTGKLARVSQWTGIGIFCSLKK